MTLEPLGDAALILRDLDQPAFSVAAQLRESLPGVEDAIASFDEVGLYFRPGTVLPDVSAIAAALGGSFEGSVGRELEIPVCYEMGEDWPDVSSLLGLGFEEVVAAHLGGEYRCRAVGFCPGFGYLEGLPAEISGLSRKASPRIRVEPGSVAVVGSMTAVYPLVRPAGWWIIGKTPLTLVDEKEDYFPIQVGDLIRFVRIGEDEFRSRKGERL
jgi:inhibitor of KinA